MCIIAMVPKGKVLPMNIAMHCALQNDDGWGVAWPNGNGGVHLEKGVGHYRKMKKSLRRAAMSGGPYLVHFRWATHGAVTPDNAQPIPVTPGLVMAHNGIIPGYGMNGYRFYRGKSDSVEFIEDFVSKLESGWHLNATIRESVAELTGISNRFAVLDKDGNWATFPEDSGEWHEGIWYSNGGWREYAWEWIQDDDGTTWRCVQKTAKTTIARWVDKNGVLTREEINDPDAENAKPLKDETVEGWILIDGTTVCMECLGPEEAAWLGARPWYAVVANETGQCGQCGALLREFGERDSGVFD